VSSLPAREEKKEGKARGGITKVVVKKRGGKKQRIEERKDKGQIKKNTKLEGSKTSF